MAADRMLIALNWDEAASSSVEIRFDTEHSRVGLPAVTRASQQPSGMNETRTGNGNAMPRGDNAMSLNKPSISSDSV